MMLLMLGQQDARQRATDPLFRTTLAVLLDEVQGLHVLSGQHLSCKERVVVVAGRRVVLLAEHQKHHGPVRDSGVVQRREPPELRLGRKVHRGDLRASRARCSGFVDSTTKCIKALAAGAYPLIPKRQVR